MLWDKSQSGAQDERAKGLWPQLRGHFFMPHLCVRIQLLIHIPFAEAKSTRAFHFMQEGHGTIKKEDDSNHRR